MNLDQYVSQEFQNLAQVIYDYDQNLRLEMIPFEKQHTLLDKSKVFRIIDTRNNTVVMTFDSVANPTDILTRLWSSDLSKNDVVGLMDARNAAIEALANEKIIAQREAAKDLSAFILKNTKSRWTHEGRIRDDEFRDLGPVRKVVD